MCEQDGLFVQTYTPGDLAPVASLGLVGDAHAQGPGVFTEALDARPTGGGDSLGHTKFAEAPAVVRSIGARLATGQTLNDGAAAVVLATGSEVTKRGFKPLAKTLEENEAKIDAELIARAMEQLRTIPGLVDLDSSLKADKPTVEVDVLRDAAGTHDTRGFAQRRRRIVGLANADLPLLRGSNALNLRYRLPGAPVEEIAALMTTHKISRLPVMRGEKLVGIVSRADIVGAIASGRHIALHAPIYDL